MILREPIIFSVSTYSYLKESICKHGNLEIGTIEKKVFPDGEVYHRIKSDISDKDVILIGGSCSDSDTLETFDLACAMVKYGARSLTIVMPYYGYSTMERSAIDGEVVTAKTRARLFSAIPLSPRGNRIILFDLHSDGITYYFEGAIRPFHLYARPIILNAIKEITDGKDFVLASTDAGRAKWVQSMANELGVRPSFVFKKRIDGSRTEVTAVNAQVENKHVVIYDDMIRTGSSLINAARAYLDSGAIKVSAIATHGLFPDDSLEKLKNTNLFEKIICTDSHPRAVLLEKDFKGFLEIKSISEIIYNYLIT